jgi:hypothetical protein
MRHLALAFVLVSASSAAAQVQSRPTDPPVVTAANESWYQLGEPLQFAGDVYYRAGAQVFFNGNSMVRSGHYNGVPLYTDTTIEPYSIVYVPIGRGLLQPYERLRQGALAGTTGSRTPSFPGRLAPGGALIPNAAIAPTSLPQPLGAISVFTPETYVAAAPSRTPDPAPAAGVLAAARQQPQVPDMTLRRAENNDGIWVMYSGQKWVSAGPVVPLIASEFVIAGDYSGFPVYTRRESSEDAIYLPSTPNHVAPYRLKR